MVGEDGLEPPGLGVESESWAAAEEELCEWIIVTLPNNMDLSNGRPSQRVVAVAWWYVTFRGK